MRAAWNLAFVLWFLGGGLLAASSIQGSMWWIGPAAILACAGGSALYLAAVLWCAVAIRYYKQYLVLAAVRELHFNDSARLGISPSNEPVPLADLPLAS